MKKVFGYISIFLLLSIVAIAGRCLSTDYETFERTGIQKFQMPVYKKIGLVDYEVVGYFKRVGVSTEYMLFMNDKLDSKFKLKSRDTEEIVIINELQSFTFMYRKGKFINLRQVIFENKRLGIKPTVVDFPQ